MHNLVQLFSVIILLLINVAIAQTPEELKEDYKNFLLLDMELDQEYEKLRVISNLSSENAETFDDLMETSSVLHLSTETKNFSSPYWLIRGTMLLLFAATPKEIQIKSKPMVYRSFELSVSNLESALKKFKKVEEIETKRSIKLILQDIIIKLETGNILLNKYLTYLNSKE